MERMYRVHEICERYQCAPKTARKYMRDMEHMENPLLVSERAIVAWERRKTVPPDSVTRGMMRERKV